MNLSSPRTRETTFEPYHRRKGGASPAQLTAFPVYISRRVLGQCFATAKGRGGSMPGNREKSKCFVWSWRKNRGASHNSVRRASGTWQGLSLSSSSLFYICVVQKVSAATCGGLASLCVEYCCEMFVKRQIPIMGGKDTHTHTHARARARAHASYTATTYARNLGTAVSFRKKQTHAKLPPVMIHSRSRVLMHKLWFEIFAMMLWRRSVGSASVFQPHNYLRCRKTQPQLQLALWRWCCRTQDTGYVYSSARKHHSLVVYVRD